jgi:hypothetical protein
MFKVVRALVGLIVFKLLILLIVRGFAIIKSEEVASRFK